MNKSILLVGFFMVYMHILDYLGWEGDSERRKRTKESEIDKYMDKSKVIQISQHNQNFNNYDFCINICCLTTVASFRPVRSRLHSSDLGRVWWSSGGSVSNHCSNTVAEPPEHQITGSSALPLAPLIFGWARAGQLRATGANRLHSAPAEGARAGRRPAKRPFN
jgi:hypothetical protein